MVQAAALSRVSNLVEKRLATYGTMAVAAIACGGTADAAPIITYLGPDITANNSKVWFNPVTGQAATSLFTGAKFYLRNVNSSQGTYSFSRDIFRLAYVRGIGFAQQVQLGAGGYGSNASRLRTSGNIPGGVGFGYSGLLALYDLFSFHTSNSFHDNTGSLEGNWVGGGRGYIGLRFDHLGNLHYGWADITVDPDTFAITLHRLAWDDAAETPIHAGSGAPIPEPASVVLLAMGAAGLAAYRRRKTAKS